MLIILKPQHMCLVANIMDSTFCFFSEGCYFLPFMRFTTFFPATPIFFDSESFDIFLMGLTLLIYACEECFLRVGQHTASRKLHRIIYANLVKIIDLYVVLKLRLIFYK